MIIGKYSFGIGDRFGRQGKAQLQAVVKVSRLDIDITPVWNKSHREHTIIGTTPAEVRREADDAVESLDFKLPYFVDADHINLKNVDLFTESSDFFTIDVADFIGQSDSGDKIKTFVDKHEQYTGKLTIPDIDEPIEITRDDVTRIAKKVLLAVNEAGKIYRHIEQVKGKDNFVTEISMDETDQPQTPVDMLFILAAIADEGIPVQTIAPKFTGRFNKGVDYVGDVAQFEKEFNQDLAVIAFAIEEFGLPENLKLSVHSGSDKFSIYGPINRALKRFGTGLHLKTAGTTWLEELIGLALAGGDGLAVAKEVYIKALLRLDELCGPYKTVINISKSKLPSAGTVKNWSGQDYAQALRHDQSCEKYNPHLRQLLHVGYKVAAEMGKDYLRVLDRYETIIAEQVTSNIYQRHIEPLFID